MNDATTSPTARTNARQEAAIGLIVATYDADPERELVGWSVIDPAEFIRGGEQPKGSYVEFLYRDHYSSPDRPPGREVTILAADGDVISSQDFG